MKRNTTDDYICPICLGIQGIENDKTLLKQSDLVFSDELVSVWISSFWVGRNTGHVIVVPNKHFENLYDLPDFIGHRIFEVSKKISVAIKKVYQCDGVTLRQNNEPAGDQHALHYHLHIFPRYRGDTFNQELTKQSRLSSPDERSIYCEKLKEYLSSS